jgi:DNA processing protein
MPLDARIDAWARLALAQLSPAALAALLRTHGSAEAVVAARVGQEVARSASDMASRALAAIDAQLLDASRRWLESPGHELIAWDDPDYPRALLEVGDAPPALFFIGRRELLNRPAIAIVGSRHGTPQGQQNAREFARALSDAGLTIVSGMAIGIDAAAHEGALEAAGSTIACVGTGLDRVYPARHRDLAHRIAQRGGLLSEFIPGTPPLRHNFPRRNRLISGLAKGVLVVEATTSSGSLITARLAGEQSREVFAIPGSIHSPLSRGCHKLIREGAKLVETAQDVLDELKMPGLRSAPSAERAPPVAPHRTLIDALGRDPCSLDMLMTRTHLAAETLSAALVELELDGHVAALPGGLWQRLG